MYTILTKTPDQKIARPFKVALNVREAAEVLAHFTGYKGAEKEGSLAARRAAVKAANAAYDRPQLFLNEDNIGTEKPVLTVGDRTFYIFAEAEIY